MKMNFDGNSFESHCKLWENVDMNKLTCINGELNMIYKVPESLCVQHCHSKSNKFDKILNLGGLLALTDQITSVLCICHDPLHRPGVSVSLCGERFNNQYDIKSGNKVRIVSKISKIGLTLGFIEMTVYLLNDNDSSEKKVAFCKHTKYLKMGYIWDHYGSIFPMFIHVIVTIIMNITKIYYFIKSIFVKDAKKDDNENKDDANLDLTNSLNIQPYEGKKSNNDNGNSNGIKLENCLNQFMMQSNRSINNPFKSIHGKYLYITFNIISF
jgi:hypothetical protein